MADAADPSLTLTRNRLGWVITAAYAATFLTYSVVQGGTILTLAPNEFAEFLAGAFSPLAFLWLVLGFYQQGAELKASVSALHLQGEELRASVEQQRELVGVTRSQLDYDREQRVADQMQAKKDAKPILRMRNNGHTFSSGDQSFRYSLINSGVACTDITMHLNINPDGVDGVEWLPSIDKNSSHPITLTFHRDGATVPPNASLRIGYTDARGERDEVSFQFATGDQRDPRRLIASEQPCVLTDC